MDLLNSSLVLYLMVGAGIGFTVYLSGPSGTRVERLFRVLTAVLFWPLYVPLLLRGARLPAPIPPEPPDELAGPIAQVTAELQAAVASLRGWADSVLAEQAPHLEQFRAVWIAQARRIREMDRLLLDSEKTARLAAEATGERWQHSEEARQRNLENIRRVREKAYDALMATLAWVRELVSMLHLARFTGAPAVRAKELLAQIADAVNSLADESWQDMSVESKYREGPAKTPAKRLETRVQADRARSAVE